MNARERELREMVEAFGGTLVKTNGGHWKATLPNGEFCFMSGTPSDARALDNARAQLQRAARRHTVPVPPAAAPVPPQASSTENTENTENDKEESVSNKSKNTKNKNRGDFTALSWEERIRRREWLDGWCRKKISEGTIPTYAEITDAMRDQFGSAVVTQLLKESIRRALAPVGVSAPSNTPYRRWAVDKIKSTPGLTVLRLRRMLRDEFQVNIGASEAYDFFIDANVKPHQPTREEYHTLVYRERMRVPQTPAPPRAAPTPERTALVRAQGKKGSPDEAVNAALKMLLEEISNLKGLTVQVATDGQVDVSYELYETRTTTFRVK